MSQPNIPKNQITSKNTISQREHEENAAARRVLLVDEDGNPTTLAAGGASSVQLDNITNVLIQGFLGNADKFLTDEQRRALYDLDGSILTE